MPNVKSIHKLSISKARVFLTKLDRMLLPGEVVCVQRQEIKYPNARRKKAEWVPVYALVPWELFEQMWEVTNTIEDKLQMMEFIKFMKDNSKTHVFTDILRKLYTTQGYYDTEDDFDKDDPIPAAPVVEEPVAEKPKKEYPLWKNRRKRKAKSKPRSKSKTKVVSDS